MADYVPFVNNDADYQQVRESYSDAAAVRLLLPALRSPATDTRGRQMRLWIDAGLDGYHGLLTKKRMFDTWKEYIGQFNDSSILADPDFVARPSSQKIKCFVFSVLDHCATFHPAWLTVPQLPVVDDVTRNNVNRKLAEATREWAAKNRFAGRLVLPLVFTHQDQLKGRSKWRNTLTTAVRCCSIAGATALWAVDSDLDDQRCRSAFNKRFAALIAFHEDLKAMKPEVSVICGPYWGMNIVLWARGLCDYPAVSLGTGYSYMISGAFRKQAKRFHIALPPLRRWAIASPELKTWLDQTVDALIPADSAHREFAKLRHDMGVRLKDKNTAKEQVAKWYHEWFSTIESISPAGRTLALYQDLSSAYVLGKQLPKLPKSEAPGREAGKVAEQLMLHCL